MTDGELQGILLLYDSTMSTRIRKYQVTAGHEKCIVLLPSSY